MMKLILFMFAAGASLLVLAGCSIADFFEGARVFTDVAVKLGPLVAPDVFAEFQKAVAEGAPQVEAALGLVADVLKTIDTEATARFAAQAEVAQGLTNELATRITTNEALMLSGGTGLIGGGGGTAWSRALSKKKHGK